MALINFQLDRKKRVLLLIAPVCPFGFSSTDIQTTGEISICISRSAGRISLSDMTYCQQQRSLALEQIVIPSTILMVDIGGNKGHEGAGFHKAYPELPGRFIIQDLPPMIERVRQRPPRDVELMPYDIFTPQPVTGEHHVSINFMSVTRLL